MKRYRPMPSNSAKAVSARKQTSKALYPSLETAPMEAKLAEALPVDDGWQFDRNGMAFDVWRISKGLK